MLPSKDTLERIKLFFGIIVGAALFSILIAIIIWPGRLVGGIVAQLESANVQITKFVFLGVEGTIRKAGEAVEEAAARALAELDDAKAKLSEAHQLLRCQGSWHLLGLREVQDCGDRVIPAKCSAQFRSNSSRS